MALQIQPLLDTLLNDQQSGSTELALNTVQQLKVLLEQSPPQAIAELEIICSQLRIARPSMVALGNALQRWLDSLPPVQLSDFKNHYLQQLDQVRHQLQQASRQVAEHAASLIQPGMTIMSHSRSSQVMALFSLLVERHISFKAIVTLSAPGNEGLLVAKHLNDWQVPTTVITDAEMGLFMPQVDINICGCDSWLADDHFVNKSGTLLQALAAQHFGKPLWVLADSFKNSHQTCRTVTLEEMAAAELDSPESEFIEARNIYFETIPTRLITGRVDECGLHREML